MLWAGGVCSLRPKTLITLLLNQNQRFLSTLFVTDQKCDQIPYLWPEKADFSKTAYAVQDYM